MKIGGKTVKFELMSEDDQADPKMGPTIAQKFADAKGRRRCRSPEFRVSRSRLGRLQPGRHSR
jgi:hypothetical protein